MKFISSLFLRIIPFFDAIVLRGLQSRVLLRCAKSSNFQINGLSRYKSLCDIFNLLNHSFGSAFSQKGSCHCGTVSEKRVHFTSKKKKTKQMVTVLKISFSSSSYKLFHILSTFLSIKALTEVSIYGAPFKSKFKLF